MLGQKETEYIARSLIRYMNGDIKEYEKLVSKAIFINENIICNNCGDVTNPAKLYITKWKYKFVEICTNCGQIEQNGNVLRKGNSKCGAL